MMQRFPGILLLAVLLAGCGARVPDLEAPQVRFVELHGRQGEARLRIDNPVAAPMPVTAVALDIQIGDQRLGRFEPPLALTIPPLGSEQVRIEFQPGSAAIAALGEGRVRYRIEGVVSLDAGRTLRIDSEGWLSPTPGRPGSYR